MGDFYNGDKLCKMKDLDGMEPEIYICCGNRTAGKSFYFKRKMVEDFLKFGKKFLILRRKVTELKGCFEAFMKDLKDAIPEFEHFQDSEESCQRSLYMKIFLNGEHCGYVAYLNSSDALRNISAEFIDVEQVIFDEFQSEIEGYVEDEIKKFLSIRVSIARGKGKHTRFVPYYMVSNTVSILNPYFVEMGIHKRLDSKTKFLRGHGYVCEFTKNETSAKEIIDSRFMQAFSESEYVKFAADNSYLLDNNAFIEKTSLSNCTYQATVFANKKAYGVWLRNDGILYVANNGDTGYWLKFAATVSDMVPGVAHIRSNPVLQDWRIRFNYCLWRFQSLESKFALIDLLAQR